MSHKTGIGTSQARTPLHHAAFDGNVELARSLLHAGADPSVKDRDGWSPLHAAAQAHHPEIVALLLEHGADVNATDSNGNTPLFRAVFDSRGRGEIITLLRAAGADPAQPNAHGVSPLQLARTIANYDVAQYFSDLPAPPVA